MEKRRVGYVRPADMNGRLNVQLEMREEWILWAVMFKPSENKMRTGFKCNCRFGCFYNI